MLSFGFVHQKCYNLIIDSLIKPICNLLLESDEACSLLLNMLLIEDFSDIVHAYNAEIPM